MSSDKDQTHNCPVCGKGFETPHAVGCHGSKAHPEKYDSYKETKECEVCGEDFKHYPYEDRKYCGEDCSSKGRQNRLTKECEVCGSEFEVKVSKSDKRFCKQECFNEAARNNPNEFNIFEDGHDGYDSSPWKGKELSEEHKKNISEALRGVERSEQYIKENLEGENHWNWQGGKSYEEYPDEFNPRLRREIRERDDFECLSCGKDQADCILDHGKRLEIHHLDEDKSNNEKENLVSLCTSCHTKNHNANDEVSISEP